ncbi:MAG: 30S ribosomal protein S16 [Candidatus Omnitrophica bacterium]|jgi:small subunit ribosomal protein S16|nr:30S ribosomal protein S16 [Candidatus Omnitrophota bacterium]MDD5080661.1 30S ribosomal protein S16 [Candidatus Omnitrophota bacterium]MDD5441425.1 30S ribosomal protein S16 [Candidatus Omnitrophota bacterium]
MVKIRLMKPGKSIKGRHNFKIAVMDARKARDSKFIEELGYYSPAVNMLKIDCDGYDSWVKKGAQPTETVKTLYKRYKKVNAA